MKLLITGCNGQVGWNLQRTLAPMGEVLAIDIDQVDLTDLDAVGRTVRDFAPDVVVNAAAYTAVDKAESEPELARALNVAAPGKMAEECARTGALNLGALVSPNAAVNAGVGFGFNHGGKVGARAGFTFGW